jgi:diacylglycerol kinase family enzyme
VPDGDLGPPIYFVLNAGSGNGDAERAAAEIAAAMNAAGRAHRILCVEETGRLEDVARRAVEEASARDGAVVAVGGDGTLNAVAQAVLRSRCPFGAIPQGTFNYFGRSHGLPSDVGTAVQSLLTARIEPVPVGLANDRVFLVNASLGLYPVSLEIREAQKQRHGRSRIVAAWAAVLTILGRHPSMRIRIEGDGIDRELRTLTVFVSINPLQLQQIGVDDAVRRREFVAVVLRPASPLRLAWLMLRGALGRLVDADGVEHVVSSALSVTPASARMRRMKIAVDGETAWTNVPVEFRIADEPLRLLKPVAVPAAGSSR